MNFYSFANVIIRGAFLGKGIKDSFEYIFKTSEGHIIKFDPCLDFFTKSRFRLNTP